MGDAANIRFQCPYCSKGLRVPARLAGRRLKCPNPACGQSIEAPGTLDGDPAPPGRPRPSGRAPGKPPAGGAESAAPPPAPRGRGPRWPWYARGGVAAVGLVAAAVFFFAMSRKDRISDAGAPARGSESAADVPGKDRGPLDGGGLTREKLLGEWEGDLKDGGILALKFTDQLLVVSVLAPGTDRVKARAAADWVSGNPVRSLGGGGFGVGSTAYKIDAEKNEVGFGFPEPTARGKPTNDGALLVWGVFKTANFTCTAPETRLERVKPGTEVKPPPVPPPGASPPGKVDDAPLAKDGPGDPSITYELAGKEPAKYRGKRVTWAFVPCSTDGKRMMCALDMKEAMGPRHAGIYVVEFPSQEEAGRAFRSAAFKAGSTITGTIAGAVDQFLVVRGPDGKPQKDIPKVTVPLLVHPGYAVGADTKGKE